MATHPEPETSAAHTRVIERFLGSERGTDATEWLAGFLKRIDWTKLQDPSLYGFKSPELDRLASDLQIEVLKACIRLAVVLRKYRGSGSCPPYGTAEYAAVIDVGSVAYAMSAKAFGRSIRLPYTERDVCEILDSMHHDCGHGHDVEPPLDLALAFARQNHPSAKLIGAIKRYVDGMKGLKSVKVNGVKRRAQLLLVIDEESGHRRCWSAQFRYGLNTLSDEKQSLWRDLVVAMDAVEFGRNCKNWKAKSPPFITALGAEHVLECLSAWWPDSDRTPVCILETGGSYLLQHLIWLLDVIAEDRRYSAECDRLVVRLSELDWKPRDRAQKVVVAATLYLEQRPPDVAWAALQRFHAWSEAAKKKASETGNRVAQAIERYAASHHL